MRDYYKAYFFAVQYGIDFHDDYFKLSLSDAGRLADSAKTYGYRKPKNANGSTARYFFRLLQRRFT